MIRFALMFSALFLAAATAQAGTRTYFTPLQDGVRVSSCLGQVQSCGKPAADAFCQKQGFAESILFAREAVREARLLDGESLCTGESCQAFTRVKCFAQDEAKTAGNSIAVSFE